MLSRLIKSSTTIAACIAVASLAAVQAGCQTHEPRSEPSRAQADTPPDLDTFGYYKPRVGDDMFVTELAFPTGDTASSPLLVHNVFPRTVNSRDMFEYEIHATNLSGGTLQNVVITQESSNNMELERSNPTATKTPVGDSVWALGDLGPRETRIIKVTAKAGAVGTASQCIGASFNNSLCATTNVVQPALALEKTVTQQALICDPIEIRYSVTNGGSGIATGVVVSDDLPDGLTTKSGSRTVNINVGTLTPGQTRIYSVEARAAEPGNYASVASARADGGLEAESGEPSVLVTEPVITLVSDCRETQYLSRNVTYEFTASNTGTGDSANAVLTVNLPAGAPFVRASDGATPSGNTITWRLGTLAAGQERTVSVTVLPEAAGRYRATATLTGACADEQRALCETEIVGIPAILLEVIDITDPVEIGTETTYRIRVTNQGSARDSNIRIVCTLPEQQGFVSAGGSTGARTAGNTVTFAPLPVLQPKAVAEWTVTVRAEDEGDIRFRVSMTSDQLKTPVEETESTNLYR